MRDRLVDLLKYFELRARVFQTGPLCHSAAFDREDGLGYIHVLRRGRLRVEAPTHPPLLIEAPSLFLYLNPTTHRMLPPEGGVDLVCASIEFGAGQHNPLVKALPNVVVVNLAETPELDGALRLLFQEAAASHCGQQAILDRVSEVVIIQVLRHLMNRQRLHTGLLAGLADPRLAKAINALHAEPAAPWSLEEMAGCAGMSRARFATRFRDVVGVTPGAYLSEWRVSVAQTLLKRGKSIPYVADTVGYSNASAFSRAFRAVAGQSPLEWLKRTEAERPNSSQDAGISPVENHCNPESRLSPEPSPRY